MPRRTRKSRNLTRPEPRAARTAADKVAAASAPAGAGVRNGHIGTGRGQPESRRQSASAFEREVAFTASASGRRREPGAQRQADKEARCLRSGGSQGRRQRAAPGAAARTAAGGAQQARLEREKARTAKEATQEKERADQAYVAPEAERGQRNRRHGEETARPRRKRRVRR